MSVGSGDPCDGIQNEMKDGTQEHRNFKSTNSETDADKSLQQKAF